MINQFSMSKKIIAWMLTLCLVITLIPDLGYAAENSENAEKTVSSSAELDEEQEDCVDDPAMEELTEEQVIDKTECTTTYDLGDGIKSVVLHGGDVRFENDEGELIDYDPTLVEIGDDQTTESDISLEGYSYENKTGDKKQYLPEVLSEETPIILEYNDHQITLIPQNETVAELGLSECEATVEEEMVPDIYEGTGESLPVNAVYGNDTDTVTFTYTSGDAGIKETITLSEKPEDNIFLYKISVGDLLIKENVLDEGITIIDPDTDDIVAGIEQISSVVQSNSAAAEETSAISEELSAQATNLEEMVKQFFYGLKTKIRL